jgi:hypothetical protein
MLYQKEAQGDWGQMRATDTCVVGTEMIVMKDGTQLFLRSWVTQMDNDIADWIKKHAETGHTV